MDYRFIYTDQDGVQWAVTDYGNVRMDLYHRRQAERRQWLAIGLAIVALNLALICLIGYTMLELRHG